MHVLEPRLIQIQVQFHSRYCGLTLSAIQLATSCIWLGLVRNGQVIQASDNPTIHCGDELLAIALNKGFAATLQVTLKRTHPVVWSIRSAVYLENLTHTNKIVCPIHAAKVI